MNAETQLLYSSDYPHWDFDLPSTIYDLPFLGEKAKRNILGDNAVRVFNLKPCGRQAGAGRIECLACRHFCQKDVDARHMGVRSTPSFGRLWPGITE